MFHKDFKAPFLIAEARRWIGMKEVGGDNKGQLIEMWQKTVDAKAVKESWCMCYVQSQIAWVDKVFYEVGGEASFSRIFKSEHCFTVWHKTPRECRSNLPVPGSVAIWQYGKTAMGHCGIVSSVIPSSRKFLSIEGNTGPGDGIIREGDGVFEKPRTMDGAGEMKLLGFLIPWA
jgi:hypothetical protein